MTFDDYWANLQSKNTGLKDGAKMTISVESFRKSMEQRRAGSQLRLHAVYGALEERKAGDEGDGEQGGVSCGPCGKGFALMGLFW